MLVCRVMCNVQYEVKFVVWRRVCSVEDSVSFKESVSLKKIGYSNGWVLM